MSTSPDASAVTWSEFATASPSLAAEVRALFEQYGQAFGYLATVRRDGGPRVHPVAPVIADGGLYCFVMSSPKRRDLERDGRYALHSWPRPFEDDGFDDEEFYLSGRATAVDDAALHERVSKAVGDRPESGASFELDIERAMHKARVGGLGYTVWRPDDG